MTTNLANRIITQYTTEDENFGQKAMTLINEHYAKQPKSESAVDPDRLGAKSVFISVLRSKLIAKAGPVETDNHPEFDKMNIMTKLYFKQSRNGPD